MYYLFVCLLSSKIFKNIICKKKNLKFQNNETLISCVHTLKHENALFRRLSFFNSAILTTTLKSTITLRLPLAV